MKALNVPLVLARHWAEGGAGAADLARKVVELIEQGSRRRRASSSSTTINRRCGTRSRASHEDLRRHGHLRRLRGQETARQAAGRRLRHYPVCIAKTQYSSRPIPASGRRRAATWSTCVKCGSRGRRVHRRGMRRHHDHAGPAEGAVLRKNRRRCGRPGDRRVLIASDGRRATGDGDGWRPTPGGAGRKGRPAAGLHDPGRRS